MGKRIGWRAAAVLGLALQAAGAAQAAYIGTGLFGNDPHIQGIVKAGDADTAKQALSAPLKRPLRLDIHPLSHPLELMKIGVWLQELRPAVELGGSCVGNCALSVLLAGKVLRIRPGTAIAFGGMTELGASMKDQIDAGELFTEKDERSQASRERFLQFHRTMIAQALELRSWRARQVPLPAQARAFVDALRQWKITWLNFSDDQANFRLTADQHHCLWWVPDAEGLRQLGLDVPGYQPVSGAEAAKVLKVPEAYIYVGPAPDTLPEQPLCPGMANFNFPPLP